MHPNDGRVVSNFICQALQNENITIYGKGSQTRSFCYVEDLITAIIKIMNTPKVTGPINIGNPHEISIRTLAENIIDLTNSNSRIIYKKLPIDDPKRRCPDITRAKAQINWEPKTDLNLGLKKTINHFKNLFNL